MPNHVKPTVEQLQAEIDATQAEIDRQIAEDTTPTPSEEIPQPSEQVPEEIPQPSEQVPEETPTEEIPEETKPADESVVDWKKKFTESQREALVLHAKNKKYEQVSEITEPTEEELQSEYLEWDEMSATERKLAKDVSWNKRRFIVIDQVNGESKDIDAWNTKVDTYTEDPKVLIAHPELEGKTEEFKVFATKPTRRGVDLEDLVLAFNGELIKMKPAPKKGQMFEQGSGGPNEKPKPKNEKLSLDEAAILMQTNYKKYKELLMSGKIASE